MCGDSTSSPLEWRQHLFDRHGEMLCIKYLAAPSTCSYSLHVHIVSIQTHHIIRHTIRIYVRAYGKLPFSLSSKKKKKCHKNSSNKDCWEKSGREQLETLWAVSLAALFSLIWPRRTSTAATSLHPCWSSRSLTPYLRELSYLVLVINVAKTSENNVTRPPLYILTKPVLVTGAGRVRWKVVPGTPTPSGGPGHPSSAPSTQVKPVCYSYQKIQGSPPKRLRKFPLTVKRTLSGHQLQICCAICG